MNILEMAEATARPGIEPPTRRWRAVLGYLYGLPLTDSDVAEVAAASGRSPGSIARHCSDVTGRRRFRQLWVRAGRRARKSSTAALIAVWEALFGGHGAHVMPGEQALCAVISKDLAGALVVSRFLRLYLDSLGIKYTTTKLGNVNIVEIEGSSIAIATLAAVSEAPRGFAIPVLVLDEWAHVSSDDGHVDTDRSILAAAEPAMAQFPNALVIGISTGLGRTGVHYERVERGLGNDSETEILAVTGASWDWSKDITRVRALEIADNDPDVMATEFLGLVSENEALWMPQADAAAMFETKPGYYLPGKPFIICDFAESRDTLAYCVAAWREPDPTPRYKRKPVPPGAGLTGDIFVGYELGPDGQQIREPIAKSSLLHITHVGGIEGPRVREIGMKAAVAEVAAVAKRYGSPPITGDDRSGPYIAALFQDHGLRYSFVNYANKKHAAVLLVRGWARDRQIQIVPHAEMKKQAMRYQRFVSGSGYRYGKPNQADDYVCLLITHAVGLLRQSEGDWSPTISIDAPTRRHGRVGQVPRERTL